MKVSISWLKELVDLKVSLEELVRLIPLRTIGIKESTENFIELDMKGYNRADLLSMRGVANEVAAITDSPIKFITAPEDFIWANQNLPKTPVEITDPNLASVQCVAKIEGLKVGPSPKEWVKKLADSGMRSIDNVTDITNLIMLEYGQPLHSFDATAIKDEAIIVRAAKEGEEVETIDHKLRDLKPEDIVLSDSEKPLDVAGIMGGKDAEIKLSTTTILLSASLFNPVNVRKTSQRLGLFSEASRRFQHGISSMNTLQALDTAIKIYQSLGGKLTAINLVGNFNIDEKKLELRISKTNALIGVDLDEKAISNYLCRLNFIVSKKDIDVLEVTIPYYRLDINIEEDLIEEVARMYGYENIPSKPLEGQVPEKIDQSFLNFIYQLKRKLANIGLTEIQTYSFVSTAIISNFKFPISNFVKIANPISSETEYLRDEIWPNLVEVIGKNLKQGFDDIAIFEIGKVYQPEKDQLPKETYHLSATLMNGSDNPIEELIAILNQLKENLDDFSIVQEKGKNPLFHPTRLAKIKSGNQFIGEIAEIHPSILNQFGIEERVAIFEINLGLLL